ncbi:MAG: pinensin family lanthipeptide [Bacteroidota bacterium]
MKNRNLKLNSLAIKSFVTYINDKASETVKGGDTSDSVVTCDTNYNCTIYYPCNPKNEL